MTFSTSCSLTAWISSILFWWEPSLYSRASSSLPLKVEPPSRRRPKLAARRSAVLRAPRRLPGAMPSGQSPPESRPRPRGRAPGSPPQQQDRLRLALAAPPKAASKVPPLETDLDYYSPSPRGNRRMTVGPCWARVRGPTRRPRPRRRADVGRDCSEPKLATRTSTESSHLQQHVLCLRMEYSGQLKSTASLTSTPIPVNAAHTPRDSAGGAFASRAWIGSDAASGTAARYRAVGCSMCCPQRDRSPVALGCNTVPMVPTHFAAASHLCCCAEADVPEGGSGGADVGEAMDSVAVQMWARDGLFRGATDRLSPVADVGGGSTKSRCRCRQV